MYNAEKRGATVVVLKQITLPVHRWQRGVQGQGDKESPAQCQLGTSQRMPTVWCDQIFPWQHKQSANTQGLWLWLNNYAVYLCD